MAIEKLYECVVHGFYSRFAENRLPVSIKVMTSAVILAGEEYKMLKETKFHLKKGSLQP